MQLRARLSVHTAPPGGRYRRYIKAVVDPSNSKFTLEKPPSQSKPLRNQQVNLSRLYQTAKVRSLREKIGFPAVLLPVEYVMCHWNYLLCQCGKHHEYKCSAYCYLALRRSVESSLYESAKVKTKPFFFFFEKETREPLVRGLPIR